MSLAVLERLLAHPRLLQAQTVLLYYSLPDEVCTHTLVDTLCQQDKMVLLPVVVGDGVMEIRRYAGRQDLCEGAYGILEPAGERFDHLQDIELAVVPGMAFDDEGHRLGRGKGYYDRFLPLIPHCYKIGVCFDFQRLPHIPVVSTDVPVDEVI